jgi:hypothetical protein
MEKRLALNGDLCVAILNTDGWIISMERTSPQLRKDNELTTRKNEEFAKDSIPRKRMRMRRLSDDARLPNGTKS